MLKKKKKKNSPGRYKRKKRKISSPDHLLSLFDPTSECVSVVQLMIGDDGDDGDSDHGDHPISVLQFMCVWRVF